MFTYTNINHSPMVIQIAESRHISDLQYEFNQAFPYLKIEFFKKQHGVEKPSPAQRMFSQKSLVGDARVIKEEGSLEINEKMTVAELEQAFWNRFGLSVQVFRKSGNLWLETTMTDKWTLGQQNEHGKEITDSVRKGNLPEDDFELRRGQD